ncbi:uncharacterized protein Z520_03993 [Fonsecaea multimorphosa CBS 102226]|uniref:Zn(2)-C6 fungal-type domain-containing protein n=1 Tax=Fonsecaea multimorphosa CBS 102226 TaxID=1442371 RepID=A0A0D2K3A4_9EURO|nr:uncharacterized protein Z520_03993 [Fonsecaea multimorphosa CBS 102226]KIY00308.1 hypothetical protein Z520_03993 [Fonsecaea multimorphosa CBS 102226]
MVETGAEASGVDVVPKPARLRQKRAARACDYCREKRLKCTPSARPCFNCQLYSAQCLDSRPPRARTSEPNRTLKKRSRKTAASSTNPPTAESAEVLEDASAGLTDEMDLSTSKQNYPVPSLDIHSNDQPVQGSMPQILDTFSNMDFTPSLSFWDSSLPSNDTIFFGGDIDVSAPLLPSSLLLDHSGLGPNPLSYPPNAPEALQSYANVPGSISSATYSQDGKVSGVQALHQNAAPDVGKDRILPGLFIRNDALTSHFIGLNSTGATLALSIREALEFSGPGSMSTTFDWLIETGKHVDEAGVRTYWNFSTAELPSQEVAATSIEAYLKNAHVFYPIINWKEFEEMWPLVYDPNVPARDVLDVSCFFLVVAIGILCHATLPNSSEAMRRAGVFYQQAWNMLGDAMVAPRIKSVQVLLLHVIYLSFQGKGGIAWSMCGSAIRHAQCIGLHRRSPQDLDLTKEQVTLRSRLWWVAFTFDAHLSMTQGRPTALTESTYDVELPTVDPSSSKCDDETTMFAQIYLWKVKLGLVQNRLCALINRHESVEARLDALTDIDQEATTWRDEIPVEFRPEQEILVSPDLHQVVALLHLEYYNMIRAIHFAALTSIPAHKVGNGSYLSPRMKSSQMVCLAAARSFIKTLNNMTDDQGQKRIFPIMHTTDYYMTMLAELFRNTFHCPHRLSAKADLEHFRAGKIHFENDVPEPLVSTPLKLLFDKMLKSLEQRVYGSST